MSAKGAGNACRILTTMDSSVYAEILERHMRPSTGWLPPYAGAPYILQQNNDPKCTSRMTRDWLALNHVAALGPHRARPESDRAALGGTETAHQWRPNGSGSGWNKSGNRSTSRCVAASSSPCRAGSRLSSRLEEGTFARSLSCLSRGKSLKTCNHRSLIIDRYPT